MNNHYDDIEAQFRAIVEGKPLKPDAQWDRCEYWRKRLESDAAERDWAASDIIESWEKVADADGVECYRGKDLKRAGASPLEALFNLVGEEHFQFPPPELLLTLRDAWNRYMFAKGGLTLEQAFFGPPVPKAGAYARRQGAAAHKRFLRTQMTELVRQGKSQAAAAEVIAKAQERAYGQRVDADSIARTIKPYRRRKHSATEK